MNCPICKKEMKVKSTDISYNGKEKVISTRYNRTIYHCEEDDTWANIEIPTKQTTIKK